MLRGRRFEIATVGFDENLQLVGSDASGGTDYVGLRVPDFNVEFNGRYMFMLCMARFNAGERARLVGFRQMLTIGATPTGAAPFYIMEQQVLSPWWHFQDADVNWQIRRVKPFVQQTANLANRASNTFRYSTSPSILFENATGAPYGGQAPGDPLVEYGSFYDIRNNWKCPTDTDLPIEGPCDIAFFASLKQTNIGTRTVFTPLDANPANTNNAIPVEDVFTFNFTAIYWRIAGALIFEEVP